MKLRPQRKSSSAGLATKTTLVTKNNILSYRLRRAESGTIVCNRHNSQSPSSLIVIDKAGQWLEIPPAPGDVSDGEADPHDNLSAYELERRERIERHCGMMQS